MIVEFVPNADRVTPPQSAGFALVMLATTPEGDAYTSDQYAAMLEQAGFEKPTAHTLPASMKIRRILASLAAPWVAAQAYCSAARLEQSRAACSALEPARCSAK